jgi:hypothetical protein
MASAIQNPRTSLDSPSNDPPSGVNEKSPFMPRSISVFCSPGSSLRASSHGPSKSSGVNSMIEGISRPGSRCLGISSGETGIERCL